MIDDLLQDTIKYHGFKRMTCLDEIKDFIFYVVAMSMHVGADNNPDLKLYGASTTVGKMISTGKHCNADISKACQLLGYDPEYDFARGLNEVIKWYNANL